MFNLTAKLHNAFAPMYYSWAYLRCVHSSQCYYTFIEIKTADEH